jgi:hypothetical protein
MWREVLRGGECKMLDELIAVSPNALTREDLGDRTGYTARHSHCGALGSLPQLGHIRTSVRTRKLDDTTSKSMS